MRAKEQGIAVEVVHNASIMNAVGCCGLQLYHFGETISIPYWTDIWKPDSFYDKIKANRDHGLHTLCLLDIRVKEPTFESLTRKKIEYEPPRFMSTNEASDQLLQILDIKREAGIKEDDLAYNEKTLVVGVCRVGHQSQKVLACSLEEMKTQDMGAPLHSMIIPAAKLHPIEIEYLEQYRNAIL